MKRILLLAASLLSFSSFAQIDPTVEVNRSYDAAIGDIVKPDLPVTVADSLHRFDINFDYSIFNRRYAELYEFNPFEATSLGIKDTKRPPLFYSRIGTQFPLIPSAELYFQSGTDKGAHFTLYGRHDSFWGKLPQAVNEDITYDAGKMKNKVGGNLTYAWATGEMSLDASYGFDRFDYPSDIHNNNAFDISAKFNSANSEENSIYYDVTLAYRNTSRKVTQKDLSTIEPLYSLGENYLKAAGFVGASFDKHRVYIDMNLEFAKYSVLHDFSTGVVEVSPMYQLRNKWLDAKLGIKFGNNYTLKGKEVDTEMESETYSTFCPNIDARFTLMHKVLWVRALIGGGNDINQYSKLLKECPVLVPYSDLKFGNRPIDAKLALESYIFGRLSLNIFGSFTVFNDKLAFVPEALNADVPHILALYRDMNYFGFGAEAFLQTQDFSLGGKIQLNNYKDSDEQIVTELPKCEANAFLRYSFRERIIAQADFNYRSDVSGKCLTGGHYSVPAIVDLDFNLNYIINRNLAVYGKIGNILNKRNQYVPLYVEPGRNFGGGLCVSF
ncbi:MAG: TonB-dependent receptor [Bacteroidales bacterium]|nr:TonB-dependent receptor [Candidatus Cacconaster equifaecalis]